jgi:hypothetical protein
MLSIQFPGQRIIADVLANASQVSLVSHYVIMTAPLPEPSAIARPSLLGDATRERADRPGFEIPNDNLKSETCTRG